MHTVLENITEAGGEMEYQTTEKTVVIQLFTEPRYLPAIKQILNDNCLYLQRPVNVDLGCPYYNYQILHFGPPHERVSTYTRQDGSEYSERVILPKVIAEQMGLVNARLG
jgi:hypothetical protein